MTQTEAKLERALREADPKQLRKQLKAAQDTAGEAQRDVARLESEIKTLEQKP